MVNPLKIVPIFGIPFTICTLTDGIKLLERMIENAEPKLVVLANVNTLNFAYSRRGYKRILKKAALVLRDGVGVAWALRKRNIDPLHNFVGTDFIPTFFKQTADKGYRVFLLGARKGIAEVAAANLKSMVPGLVIAGNYHGYFSSEQTPQVIDYINAAKPDILLVAMGNPRQELWIAKNRHKLKVPVCIGVGALFDYISGRVRRAPHWMLNLGMEWVFRLLVEPIRLARRYLIGNPKFIVRVYRELS